MKKLYTWIIYSALCLSLLTSKGYSHSRAIHILLSGRVMDPHGKGIKDVPVSDGTNITLTDSAGRYRLESTNESKFVFITIPSGYEIPTQDFMPAFYKKIKASKGEFHSDFLISPLKSSDKKHYAIVWADPQVQTDEQAKLMQESVVKDTKEHVKKLLETSPVVGLAVGDISWDAPALLPQYKNAVKNSGIPFFQVLGNHDMDHTRSDETSDSTFQENFGPSWYSFNRGNAHYIILDNVFYYSKGYNYIGYISEKQLKWLEQDLSHVKPGSIVFVSMHISAYTNEKRRNGLADDVQGNITHNRKHLYKMLKPFNAHLLTGHTHYNETNIEDGVFEHIHASVCAAWWTGPVCEDGSPGGYAVYEINDTKVKWYYKSIGKPKDYQMRVYGKGTYNERPNDIAVNVWNWDEAWKVQWYEDGKLKGEMKQETYWDAEAMRIMKNDSTLTKYNWIKPGLTDHIFFATPSSRTKKIKIEVTDRFGKKYSEEINN